MSDVFWTQLFVSVVTLVTLIVNRRRQKAETVEQNEKLDEHTEKLATVATKAEVGEVHEIVNSQRTEMLVAIETLKAEVARLNAGGPATPTTRRDSAPPDVTIRDGNVTVDKTKTKE